MRFALVACTVSLPACATAGGGQQSGDDDPAIDAPRPIDARDTFGDGPPPSDAPPADTGPIPITLTQTSSDLIAASSSIACGNADGSTAENSWYRVFRLADAGISAGLRVNSVKFGVQESSGIPVVQVKIGTYSGNIMPPPTQLDTSLITPIASATFNVPNTEATAATTMTVPITANVPALSQMIVEVFSPNLAGTAKYFYLGGNNAGEAKPAYLRSGNCGTPQPRTTAALGFPTAHLVISVSGTY